MGAGSSAKFSPTRRVSDSNTNYKLRITNFPAYFRLLLLLCIFCAPAGNISAQVEEPQISKGFADSIYPESLTRLIQKGTVEEKRSALFEIRNRRSETFS